MLSLITDLSQINWNFYPVSVMINFTNLKIAKKSKLIHLYLGPCHYGDVIMGAIASQITSLAIVYLTVYSGADQRKHQSSASLAFVRGIHRWPVNSPHKWPVTRKMFLFDDVIMRFDYSNLIGLCQTGKTFCVLLWKSSLWIWIGRYLRCYTAWLGKIIWTTF